MTERELSRKVSPLAEPIPVAVLGGTGIVGQKLLQLLADHPWFVPVEVAGSSRSTGLKYGEAVRWAQSVPVPESLRGLPVKPARDLESWIVFSALPAAKAVELESFYVDRGHAVISNASPLRLEPAVPLVIPEVNPGVVPRVRRGVDGVLIKNPNCVVAGLALVLAPIRNAFGLKRLVVVTMQALSGAGLSGPLGVEMVDNILPHIPEEESKIRLETRKILGSDAEISVSVNRVPVRVGHLACVFVELERRAGPADVRRCLQNFRAPAALRSLPILPKEPVIVRSEPGRPQPRLDLGAGKGMAVTVGGLAEDPVFDVRFNLLVDNLIRGAAGGAVANAELLWRSGRQGFRGSLRSSGE